MALLAAHGVTHDLFGGISDANVARIRRQNQRRISVVIGNPPYNANQANENDNNKNREYPAIDERIRKTYIAESTAQKTKLYDMYARFFRWASDRLAADGVLAFVTNRSFIDSRTFDGFRKTVAREFAEGWIVDLGGDVRANPKLSGTRHNVFGIQTGVAISFFVKRHGAAGRTQKDKPACRLFYARRPEMETAEEKLAFLASTSASSMAFEELRPDAKGNWLSAASNDFEELLPLVSRAAKQARSPSQQRALFRSFSFGVVTNRDEWVYGESAGAIEAKIRFLIDAYNADLQKIGRIEKGQDVGALLDTSIKWTRSVKRDLARRMRYSFEPGRIVAAMYRPFVRRLLYFSPRLNEMPNLMPQYFGTSGNSPNQAIVFTDPTSQKPFMVGAVGACPDMHFVGAAAGGVVLPLHDSQADNITDWALAQFRQHYQPGRKGASTGSARTERITKEDVFHYVYSVLHDPAYREKYAQNLKREFPRIPLYGVDEAAFRQWAGWGAELMALHLGYESVESFALRRTDVPDARARAAGQPPKCVLRSEPEAGRILVDSETTLAGIPGAAWDYRLGNRSAIDWVLDQHKERKPKDPTIRDRFDSYRFADHKERVIDLLGRVATVSLRTVAIVESMKGATR